MAIGHIAVRTHSRKQGHSVAGALAYRFGLSLKSERTGETFDFSRRSDRENIAATGLSRCPFDTVEQLADAIEGAERRKDSRILRDVQMALPAELDETARSALAWRFAEALADRYKTTIAWAVHRPDKRSDERNHHAHIVLPTRRLDDTGQAFGAKLVQLDDPKQSPAELAAIRELWETLANQALRQAKSEARVHTGRTENPIPTIPRRHVAIERRAWSKRNKRHPRGLSVPELVADGSATGPGRHLAQHVRTRKRRQERSHEAKRVAPAEARMDAEIGSKTRVVGPSAPLPLPSPALSPAEEIDAIDREIAELKRAAFETWLADEPRSAENVPQETLQSAPSAPTPGTAPSSPAILRDAQNGAQDAPATKPRRTRGEDWSVRTLAGAAAQQRTGEEPEPHPVETDRAEAKAALDAFLAQDPDPPSPDAHTHAPDQGRDRGPLTHDTAPAESPREAEESKTVPPDEIARQRRRAGPAVSAHAANHGRAPTAQETNRAVEYLKGGHHPDGTPRPALGAAVDQCARAAFVGQPLATDPLAEACASTAAAAEARRMTVASVETFKRQHPPQRGIISALEEWRRTLRPGLMRKILTVIVPLEVQHNRRRRNAPDQAQRPPGPGFGI